MCPKQVHEGNYDDLDMSLSVVVIDLGNLRGQIFSRTGFAPSGGVPGHGRRSWLLRHIFTIFGF